MNTKLSLPSRKGLLVLLVIYLILLGSTHLDESYFPSDTECSFFSRFSGTQCTFAIEKSSLNRVGYFSEDGNSIIFIEGNYLRIEPIGIFESIFSGKRLEHPHRIWNLTLSSDRTKAITCIMKEDDLSIMEFWIWDLVEGRLVKKMDALPYGCGGSMHQDMKLSQDGKTLIVNHTKTKGTWSNSDTRKIDLIDLDSGTLKQISGDIFTLSPDGRYLAIQDDTGIRVIRHPSLDVINNLEVPENVFDLSFTFSNDGKTLIGNDTLGFIYVWNVETGILSDVLRQLETAFCIPVFSPNNKNFFSCSYENQADGSAYNSYVFLWGAGHYRGSEKHVGLEQIIELGNSSFMPFSLDISPDGSKLMVVGDENILVFQIADYK